MFSGLICVGHFIAILGVRYNDPVETKHFIVTPGTSSHNNKAVRGSTRTESDQLSTKIPFYELHTLHDNTHSYYSNDLVLI